MYVTTQARVQPWLPVVADLHTLSLSLCCQQIRKPLNLCEIKLACLQEYKCHM